MSIDTTVEAQEYNLGYKDIVHTSRKLGGTVHIVGYTTIAFQEMNLCYKFSPLYWQAACLIVDSGGLDADGNNEYGKISKAASSLSDVVSPPDINKSGLTFTPNNETGTILFGLKPIAGLRKDLLESIMMNRPYNSIGDFIDKTGATINQVNILIKSGAFNNLYNTNAREVMIKFVDEYAVEDRDKLTMSNFEDVYLRILDKDKYKNYYDLYQFRVALRSKEPKNTQFDEVFINKYNNHVEYDFDKEGRVSINTNSFEKFYNNTMKVIREEVLTNPEVLNEYNRLQKRDYWTDNCLGSVESWEMDTISFYSDRHEFEFIPVKNYFPVQNYNTMTDGQRGVIAGTVVDKNKAKSTIHVFTQDGVVAVKMWRNVFYEYDEVVTNGKKGNKRIVYDDSWFTRGTKVVLVGRKNGVIFHLDNRRTEYGSSIYKITKFDKETMLFTSQKRRG